MCRGRRDDYRLKTQSLVRIDYDKQQQITCSGKLNLDDTIEQILNTITETAPVVISKENNVYKVTIKKK